MILNSSVLHYSNLDYSFVWLSSKLKNIDEFNAYFVIFRVYLGNIRKYYIVEYYHILNLESLLQPVAKKLDKGSEAWLQGINLRSSPRKLLSGTTIIM